MEPTTPMIEIESARMAAAYRTLARQMLENRLQIEAAHMKPREGDTYWRTKPGMMGLMGSLERCETHARTEEKTKRRFDWELSRIEGGALLYEAGIGRAWVTLDTAGQMLRIESGQELRNLIERGFPRLPGPGEPGQRRDAA